MMVSAAGRSGPRVFSLRSFLGVHDQRAVTFVRRDYMGSGKKAMATKRRAEAKLHLSKIAKKAARTRQKNANKKTS